MACLAGSKRYFCVLAIRVPRPFRIPLTEADFSYTVSQDILKIVDLDLGGNSVTNDAERVLRKRMAWDGWEVRFFSIRERDERAAERKLRQLTPPPGRIEPLS
jgi:hypothetical protein